MRRQGPAWPGTISNVLNLALLIAACVGNYWFSGPEGYVGLWKQCYYGLPCQSPEEIGAQVARVVLVLGILLDFVALIIGFGVIGFIRPDFPGHVLACFICALAGFTCTMATIIYIAGYYMSMSLSWSWICALLGSFSLLIITGPLYWYSYRLENAVRNMRFRKASVKQRSVFHSDIPLNAYPSTTSARDLP